MKILKYLTVIASVMFFASCEKQEVKFEGEEVLADNMAEMRLHYVEPLTSGAATRFDSLYINGVLYANSTNSFGVYNVLPNSNKFYVAPAGTVNMQLWRKSADPIYNYDITAAKGKQEIFIYDIEEAPIVINTPFPYYSTIATGTAATWGADSTAYVEFYNFMYEEYGTNKVRYNGTLKLQYQDLRDAEKWHDIGEAVEFGQAGGRAKVTVIKPAGIDATIRTMSFRMVDADGNVLKYTNTNGKEEEYTMTNDIQSGRVYMFYARGIRTSKSITTGLTVKAIH